MGDLYRPSKLFEFLRSAGIEPTRSLSQNFLVDGNIVRKIVSCAGVTPGEKVLEIGSGPGVLTETLLEAGAKVIAVEKDEELAHQLARLAGDLTIYAEDIRGFDFATKWGPGQGKVIANLPYHITGDILKALVRMEERFSALYVLIQKEAAERFVAPPKSKEYGLMSALLQHYGELKVLFSVKATCFFPRPKVDSAVLEVRLKERKERSLEFEEFLATSFSQKRKTLRKILGPRFSSLGNTRAVELSAEELYGLFSVQPEGPGENQ